MLSPVLPAGAILIAVTLTVSARTQSASSASSLAGTVFNDDNAPVACARVVLQGAGARAREVLSTRTGADGRFVFNRVPFRARWIGVEGDGSTVIDDKRFPEPANMTLVSHAGVLLAGVLLDAHHQPVRNVEVTALTRRQQYGRPRFVPVANDVTEADGSYCIRVPTSQSGGEFLVGVIPTGTWLTHPVWAVDVVGLAGHPPTYFPSVTTVAAAQVLTLQRGEARRNVSFALQTGRLSRIEGDVVNPDVLTLSASDIVLEPPDEDVAIHRSVTPDAKGHFVFSDVPPGEYTVRVFPIGRPEGGGRWGGARVTVRGESSVHVTVASRPTQTFAGVASFAGEPRMLPGVPSFFTINADRVFEPSDRFPPSFYPSAFSSSDGQGRFAIKNLVPGKYRLSISGADWRGWHLDSITVPQVGEDGSVETRDVTKTPLVVEAGRDTFGAKVQLSPQVPQITGVVHDDTGKPIGSRVLVFPADERTNWRADIQSRPDGTFANVDAVPPGDYLAVALRDASPYLIRTPALLAELRPLATRLTVGPYPATVQITLTQVVWLPRGATAGPRLRSKR